MAAVIISISRMRKQRDAGAWPGEAANWWQSGNVHVGGLALEPRCPTWQLLATRGCHAAEMWCVLTDVGCECETHIRFRKANYEKESVEFLIRYFS